jgi:hypothetical protein
MLTNADFEFNAASLTEFSDKFLVLFKSTRELGEDDIEVNLPENFLNAVGEIYGQLTRELPVLKNILIFLRENIDTEQLQIFANFFNLSAKLKVEGDSFSQVS